jgi:hypothetical protein
VHLAEQSGNQIEEQLAKWHAEGRGKKFVQVVREGDIKIDLIEIRLDSV